MPRLSVRAYLSALPAVISANIKRWTCQAYVTDALQIIAENTAVCAAACSNGKAGKTIVRRWFEPEEQAQPEAETRTAEEVIEGIRRKCRGR